MNAPNFYLPIIQHKEWARNGAVPHHNFMLKMLNAMNHIMAYRRKTFLVFGGNESVVSSETGYYRTLCRTGHAATHIEFHLGIGTHSLAPGGSYLTVRVKESGGSEQTANLYHTSPVSSLTPIGVSWHKARFAVSPNTLYEISVDIAGYAAPYSGTVYELARDESLAYFSDTRPSALHPITDALREDLLVGLSEAWKKNGSHLLSLPHFFNAGGSPTNSTTTWTNAVDGTSTSVSSSTPGCYLSDLEPWCRISEPTTLRVVFAVYARCTTGLTTGEVRLQDSTGTRVSITGITNTAQWYTTTTSITSIDSVDKLDVQARVAGAGGAIELYAVSLFCYIA